MKYHVFLSFRGTDTRTNFTDHLYAALCRQGIETFRDDVDLHKGQVIKDELLQAIEQSMFAIVVLSKNYASSSWCLDELQKIVESKKDSSETVFPVFYGIDPSDVRHQKRKFAKAVETYENDFRADDRVRRWREALTKIANLSGWDTRKKQEAGIVEDIVESVWNKLRLKLPGNFKHLVGDIQSKVDKIISLLKIGLDDKRFVGIWGMGGIGKTTLSRVVYDALRSKFEASYFFANVREDCEKNGFVYLQTKLLSGLAQKEKKIDNADDGVEQIRFFLRHKKVFIVLDDISHGNQLDKLAESEEWFGEGSKIIITTRDKQLLTQYKQFEEYGVGELNEDDSLKLLCQKAFKKDEPEEGYLDLSKEVVKYACGLPLALKVLGSFLCKRDQVQWRDALDKLKQNLHEDISSNLLISYEGLADEEYKNIFLDIACFFVERRKAEVKDILQVCGLHSVIGIDVLIEKSLLSTFQLDIENGWIHFTDVRQYMDDGLRKMRREIFMSDYLQLEYFPQDHLAMHDLLQEMGRNIVLKESKSDPCKRSRLWCLEEIDHMLKRNKGTKKVKSICLNIAKIFEAEWHPDCFSKMENLRLLDLSGVCLSRNLNVLPSSLKFLRWNCYALKSLPSIDQLCELESLELCSSKIERLWIGAPHLDKLRIINLADSHDLIETPDFSATPNLEKLFLDDCPKLFRVHESMGQLKKLVELSLRDCYNLVTLPSCLEMNNLEVLSLRGSWKLEKLPELGKNMTRLYLLDVNRTSITEIPSSIIHLINLKYLDLYHCRELKEVPELPPNLIIEATGCHLLEPKEAVAKYLHRSRVSKGPIHLFYNYFYPMEFPWRGGIPEWFEGEEHCRSRESSSSEEVEVVTIPADIPCDMADSSNGECWGIAVALAFQSNADNEDYNISVNWKFEDYCHTNKRNATDDDDDDDEYYPFKNENYNISANWKFEDYCHINKRNATNNDDDDDDDHVHRAYVGYYPFKKENCRPHPSGVGTQLHLTLSFPANPAAKLGYFTNWQIVDCRWRLTCQKHFDEGR